MLILKGSTGSRSTDAAQARRRGTRHRRQSRVRFHSIAWGCDKFKESCYIDFSRSLISFLPSQPPHANPATATAPSANVDKAGLLSHHQAASHSQPSRSRKGLAHRTRARKTYFVVYHRTGIDATLTDRRSPDSPRLNLTHSLPREISS